ncbi:hypothetical protein ACQEVY_03170 [Streptomyces sp. CA-288835]|uniref:hypothetical protein n=1 Tax=Streptomyces sp. CA-288835 TaxID=3240069 RepID=UPI003D8D9173
MAKRRYKNRKVRLVAVGAALATGGAVAALLPSANAAEEKTAEEIMRMCSKARVIDGKEQQFNGIDNVPLADSCDFIPGKIEKFNGPTEQVTPVNRNCPPNLNPDQVDQGTWSTTVGQGQGKYTVTQQGGRRGQCCPEELLTPGLPHPARIPSQETHHDTRRPQRKPPE